MKVVSLLDKKQEKALKQAYSRALRNIKHEDVRRYLNIAQAALSQARNALTDNYSQAFEILDDQIQTINRVKREYL